VNSFFKTADTLKQGARALPQKYYTDNSILKKEMAKIFSSNWLCCGRGDDILNPGQYKLINILNESIIILRDDNYKLSAFYNVCRHRGTRICTKEWGEFSKSIQCPYHGWTYDLQGKLSGTPNMNAVENFNKDDYPLHLVKLIEWEGFIFINLSNKPREFHLEYEPINKCFTEWGMADLKTIDTKIYHANCNWKLIVQNYSECYHCPLIHPSLSTNTSIIGWSYSLYWWTK